MGEKILRNYSEYRKIFIEIEAKKRGLNRGRIESRSLNKPNYRKRTNW